MAEREESYSIDILKRSECDVIIRNALGPNAITLDYKLMFASDDNMGFLGEYLKLHVLLKNATGKYENHTFFIKSLPITNKHQRALVEDLGVFNCELNLCANLFPEMDKYRIHKWRPEYYLTRSDIIVMEDLFKAGYGHINEREILTMDHVKAVLRCMASMHANSIHFEAQTGINIAEKYPVLTYECAVNLKQGWFRAGLLGIQLIADMHPKFQSEEYKNFLKNDLIDSLNPMIEIVKTSKKFKNVFCHRDSWGKNIFYKASQQGDTKKFECLLVDFQVSRYLPAAMDVLFFLHLNTRRKFRDEKLRECLQFYYETLMEILQEVNLDINSFMSWDDFEKSCEYMKLVPLFLTGVYIPTTYPVKDLTKIRKQNPDKYHYYITVNRNEFIKESVNKDSFFKEYLFEVVEELVDYAKTINKS